MNSTVKKWALIIGCYKLKNTCILITLGVLQTISISQKKTILCGRNTKMLQLNLQIVILRLTRSLAYLTLVEDY